MCKGGGWGYLAYPASGSNLRACESFRTALKCAASAVSRERRWGNRETRGEWQRRTELSRGQLNVRLLNWVTRDNFNIFISEEQERIFVFVFSSLWSIFFGSDRI